MKIESIESQVLKPLTVINAKTVQIKKVISMKDLLELRKRIPTLQKAVLIGEKIYVENKWKRFPILLKLMFCIDFVYLLLFSLTSCQNNFFPHFKNDGSGLNLNIKTYDKKNIENYRLSRLLLMNSGTFWDI